MSPLRLNGTTSGYTELSAPATAGSNTVTLPSSNGSANQFLKNGSTAGTLGWSSLIEDSSNRIGIGTTSPGSYWSGADDLVIATDADAGITIKSSTSSYATVAFSDTVGTTNQGFLRYDHFTDHLAFGVNASERMRITSNGTVVIGDTTTSATSGTGQKFYNDPSSIPSFLTVSDDNIPTARIIEHYNANASYNGVRFYVRLDGGIGNFQANDVNLSDVNSKKDIAPAAGTWDCLKEWEIVNYRYKDQPNNADLNMGVIAQQVAESCPEVIAVFQEATEDEPEKLGVKEQQMMWMAIKALQEAQLRIETLEASNAALESRIAALEVTP